MRGTGWLVAALVVLNYRPAWAQAQLANIYHVDNQQGVVFLYAENHAFVPYTIHLKAELVNMRSTDPLPLRVAVFPSKQPQLLTTFTYTPGAVYSYHYEYPAQLGIYSSRPADTTYVYRYPADSAAVPRPVARPKNRHLSIVHHDYEFDLKPGTPILAARNGIVVNFKDDARKNTRTSANFITVFHEDGSYATYFNFAPSSVGVTIGQYVKQGQRLATSETRRSPLPLVFVVRASGETIPVELPVQFAPENQPGARP